MRILAIGDVGVLDDMIHIGDEAMFDELVEQLRRRGVDAITAVSSQPDETVARCGVDAVLPVGFHPAVVGDRAAQGDRMRRVLAAASGDASQLPADDHAWGLVEAVRAADAVAIAGGGNMASIWPMHIFERATIGALAELFGKPLVVTGQTIGPELTGDDRDRVRTLLSSARLVGLREGASAELVRTLGVDPARLTQTIDDASFVGEGREPEAGRDAAPYAAVSLASHVGDADRDAVVSSLARLLDSVVDETGLEIAFLAHFAALDASVERGDSVMHRRVIDAMRSDRVRVEPTTDTPAAAAFARRASLSLSSRYHPAVFAVSAGVPTIGVAVDDYTTVKLTGALGNLGQSTVVTARSVIDGTATPRALSAWHDRAETREAWASRIDDVRAASALWWDRVADALHGRE
ncbi:polysaccharide pyruvyl transferase family protein [Frigoribacterium sp. 2-23]|uniref:polysaccharide pyruvyl transferase family protein n=1 Tax=Frigoribacterium sp. 2-23 TaxID=3415006 RepID=UPI003C6F4B61